MHASGRFCINVALKRETENLEGLGGILFWKKTKWMLPAVLHLESLHVFVEM